MGLFEIFKAPKYDMDTLAGINAIPVPAKNYNTGVPTKDCIYYVLQRKATAHKKAGNVDLAIACLRKSNELSDYESRPPLLQKDYFRLVKYLENAGRPEEAATEAQRIYKRHPEFLDKRVSNLKRIKETLQKSKRLHMDLIYITTNKKCPICSQYNHKLYSISGKSRKYPKLPVKIISEGGFCPECIMDVALHSENIE
ncbi:MAG: tetratricopeptide repeat protein [Lachnospiraceae bacterium]|nr:tetratricopeptide repeat protein [Lachnospiraceae bacterium]